MTACTLCGKLMAACDRFHQFHNESNRNLTSKLKTKLPTRSWLFHVIRRRNEIKIEDPGRLSVIYSTVDMKQEMWVVKENKRSQGLGKPAVSKRWIFYYPRLRSAIESQIHDNWQPSQRPGAHILCINIEIQWIESCKWLHTGPVGILCTEMVATLLPCIKCNCNVDVQNLNWVLTKQFPLGLVKCIVSALSRKANHFNIVLHFSVIETTICLTLGTLSSETKLLWTETSKAGMWFVFFKTLQRSFFLLKASLTLKFAVNLLLVWDFSYIL